MKTNKMNTDKGNQNIVMEKNVKKAKKIKKSVGIIDLKHPMVTAPKIDKISMVVDMNDKALHGMLISVVLGLLEEKDPTFIKGKWSTRYPLAVSILCPNVDGIFDKGGPAVFLQATKKDHPKPQVRLEFNPSKLFGPMDGMPLAKGNPCADYLDNTFNELCGFKFFEFLYHARVTSVDVCRDIYGRKPEDFLFKVKYSKVYQAVFGNDGELETLYFNKASSNQVRIYNKAKELHGAGHGYDVVRIEMRKRFKNLKIADLWGIQNLFRDVCMVSLESANPPYGLGHWIAFQDACRFRGIKNAIKLQPKSYQNKLKKIISTFPLTWWPISNEDWEWLWHDALSSGALDLIPNSAPALTMENAVGGYCFSMAA